MEGRPEKIIQNALLRDKEMEKINVSPGGIAVNK